MPTFTPFLCPVSSSGVPFFVKQNSEGIDSPLCNIGPTEMCRLYWLLYSVSITYEIIFSGTTSVGTTLELGGMYVDSPNIRLLRVPNFSTDFFHSSTGVQADSFIDFSKIYQQGEDVYSVVFSINIYDKSATVDGSDFLLCLCRSEGINGQRDCYITKNAILLGKEVIVYLNYNSNIWTGDNIALPTFRINSSFFSND